MADDIKDRLRKSQGYNAWGHVIGLGICDEAADHIEALEARIAELEGERDALKHDVERHMATANEHVAENERLLSPEVHEVAAVAFRMETAAIERDVRVHELTQGEIESLVHAVLSSARAALAAMPVQAPVADDVRSIVQTLCDVITQHHQWHAAQTTPDPEHGYVPADEYAESGLYERTVDALHKASHLLEPNPNLAAIRAGGQP